MGAPPDIDFGGGETIGPGATKTWTVNFTAPSTPGTYTGNWKMKHNGVAFGENSWLRIIVDSAGNDDATYISEGPPYDDTHFLPGENFTKTWTYENSGNTTWNDAGSYAFSFQSGEQMGAPSELSPGGDVGPGSRKTWSVNFTAPSTPGTYTTYWKTEHNGAPFGQRCWLKIIVDESATDDADYLSEGPPYDGEHFQPGETFTKTWTMRNTGVSTWGDSGGFKWAFQSGEQMGAPSEVSLASGESIGPQQLKTWSVNMTAPSAPGTYSGYWKMEHNGDAFGDSAWVQLVVDAAVEVADDFIFPLGEAGGGRGFHIHRGEGFAEPIYYHSYNGSHKWHPAEDWIADWTGEDIADTTDLTALQSMYSSYFSYTGEASGEWGLSGQDLIDLYRTELYRQGPETGIIDTAIDLYPRDPANYGFNSPVHAAANGVVVEAADFGGAWSKVIMIEHHAPAGTHFAVSDTAKVWTQYAHLNAIMVSPGDEVGKGDVIGYMGDAGGYYNSESGSYQQKEGAHLHFEVRKAYMPASSWNVTDRDTVFQNYTAPSEFITANRPDDDWAETWDTAPLLLSDYDCTIDMLKTGDVDWGKLEVPADGAMELRLSGIPRHANFDMEFYSGDGDSLGELVGSSRSNDFADESIARTGVESGSIYYVKFINVKGGGSARFRYTVHGISPTPIPGDYDSSREVGINLVAERSLALDGHGVNLDTGWIPNGSPAQLRFSFIVDGGTVRATLPGKMVAEWDSSLANPGADLPVEIHFESPKDSGQFSIRGGLQFLLKFRFSFDLPILGHIEWEAAVPYIPQIKYLWNKAVAITPYLLGSSAALSQNLGGGRVVDVGFSPIKLVDAGISVYASGLVEGDITGNQIKVTSAGDTQYCASETVNDTGSVTESIVHTVHIPADFSGTYQMNIESIMYDEVYTMDLGVVLTPSLFVDVASGFFRYDLDPFNFPFTIINDAHWDLRTPEKNASIQIPIQGGGAPPEQDDAQLLASTIPDGSIFRPNEQFIKTWTIENTGTTTWTEGENYLWTFDGGEQFGAASQTVLATGESVAPGETKTWTVQMTAPSLPGTYRGYWKMYKYGSYRFGERCWVEIVVEEDTRDTFDPEYIISDEEFRNINSMTLAEVQQFLEQWNGRLKEADLWQNFHFSYSEYPYFYDYLLESNELGRESSPAEIIYYSSRDPQEPVNQVNPQVLIVTLQKEQSLIESGFTGQEMQDRLDIACGYACPDGGGCNPQYKGFFNQVLSAAYQFTQDFESLDEWVQPSIVIDGQIITPKNRATAVLYQYTPHISTNRDFYRLYKKYFGEGSGYSDAKFIEETIPDGTVIYPGENFVKTWTLKNIGETVWTDASAFIWSFESGEDFGAVG